MLPIVVAGSGATNEALKALNIHVFPGGFRPSLALLNLLRGNTYRIRSGQAFAALLHNTFPQASPLTEDHLVVRVAADGDGMFEFVPIPQPLRTDTPLWFYVLAEAQAPIVDFINSKVGKGKPFSEDHLVNGPGAKTQLGWVGGRIVAEVFYGLMDADEESIFCDAAKAWKPIIKPKTMKDFLEFPTKAVM